MRAFEGLLRQRLPKVHAHLVKHDIALLAVIPQWFLSLFSQSCPTEVRCSLLPIRPAPRAAPAAMNHAAVMQTVARIFDSLLLEGSKVLHRVALAFFILAEPRILQARDTPDVAEALQEVTRSCTDRDLLMRLATKKVRAFSRKELEARRDEASVALGMQRKPKAVVESPDSGQVCRPLYSCLPAVLHVVPRFGQELRGGHVQASPPTRITSVPSAVAAAPAGTSADALPSSPAAASPPPVATARLGSTARAAPRSSGRPGNRGAPPDTGAGGRDVNGVDLDVYDGGLSGGSANRHFWQQRGSSKSGFSLCGDPRVAPADDTADEATGAHGNPLAEPLASAVAEAAGGESSILSRREEDMVPPQVLRSHAAAVSSARRTHRRGRQGGRSRRQPGAGSSMMSDPSLVGGSSGLGGTGLLPYGTAPGGSSELGEMMTESAMKVVAPLSAVARKPGPPAPEASEDILASMGEEVAMLTLSDALTVEKLRGGAHQSAPIAQEDSAPANGGDWSFARESWADWTQPSGKAAPKPLLWQQQ